MFSENPISGAPTFADVVLVAYIHSKGGMVQYVGCPKN